MTFYSSISIMTAFVNQPKWRLVGLQQKDNVTNKGWSKLCNQSNEKGMGKEQGSRIQEQENRETGKRKTGASWKFNQNKTIVNFMPILFQLE